MVIELFFVILQKQQEISVKALIPQHYYKYNFLST